MITLAALRLGPIQFDEPLWLWLLPVLAAISVWIARQSLSGLGTRSRRFALIIRLLVLALMVGALARPQWRKEATDLAVVAIVDSSRSVPQPRQRDAEQYIEQARAAHETATDRLGVVTVAERALAQALPSRATTRVERGMIGGDLASNLASGLRLAMAIKPDDAAYRLLLVSDGNETAGSLLEAAQAAKARGVPIDVLPVRYRATAEVTLDQLVAPTTARMGETVALRVVLTSTQATRGRLSILLNDEPIDLDPQGPGTSELVDLRQGLNTLTVPVQIPRVGPQRFRALFEPIASETGIAAGDTILENNEALAVSFVASVGRVLVVAPTTEHEALQPLMQVLLNAKLEAALVPADQLPKSLTDLNGYDAIVLANQPAYDLSQQSQLDLKAYVHDSGGGLVMIGGPDSFGVGGWIGSPLEDALPIRLDPPQKREMPKGALVLISHSVEMPDGVSWGKKTAIAAIEALSRLDLVGLVEYRGGASASVVHPLSQVGDGSAAKQAVNRLVFGDMQDYSGAFQLSIDALNAAEAGAKHIILISDGDAQSPSLRQIQDMRKGKISCSTVGVFPHNRGDLQRLANIAQATGGRHYEVVDQNGLGQIVQIFIKEAQTVKRSLIWEGTPFSPTFVGTAAENMRGFTSFPPISGYIVAGDREGLSIVTLRGKENDPIAAQWQHGLGRVFTFTSDAAARWNPAWIGWPGYRAFWEQTLRWAMRPGGNANVRITTERDGDTTRVIVDALDAAGERLNAAQFAGRIAGPGGAAQDLTLRQVGPGRYEGTFDTKDAGSYVLAMRYAAPGTQGQVIEGSAQAAVTKPFADEFRAREANVALLEQVAAMTGGRVLAGDPRTDNLFNREGLTFPVALTPIWHVLALSGIALFLADVGVRRVRIDFRAIRNFFFARSARTKAGEQLGGLKAARESAKRTIAQRAAPTADAARKFEASPQDLSNATITLDTATPSTPKPVAQQKKPDPSEPPEGGLARLKQAKKRAQDDLND